MLQADLSRFRELGASKKTMNQIPPVTSYHCDLALRSKAKLTLVKGTRLSASKLVAVLAITILAGCEALPPAEIDTLEQPLQVTELQNLNTWLNLASQASQLNTEQVASELRKTEKPKNRLDLFYYAALNQRLNHRDGWVRARDSFRKLANDISLEEDLRGLARLLQAHNQALINWHERHSNLQKELADSVLDRELLRRKIEALTDLEAVISNRKQQDVSSPPAAQNRATPAKTDSGG